MGIIWGEGFPHLDTCGDARSTFYYHKRLLTRSRIQAVLIVLQLTSVVFCPNSSFFWAKFTLGAAGVNFSSIIFHCLMSYSHFTDNVLSFRRIAPSWSNYTKCLVYWSSKF